MTTNTKHTVDSIRTLIETNDRAVERAIIALYERQTQDEKAVGDTRHHNKIGFNGADAKFLSYAARLILSGHKLYPSKLQEARRRLGKYSGQLLRIAEEKQSRAGA
jgi:hypothetical protein